MAKGFIKRIKTFFNQNQRLDSLEQELLKTKEYASNTSLDIKALQSKIIHNFQNELDNVKKENEELKKQMKDLQDAFKITTETVTKVLQDFTNTHKEQVKQTQKIMQEYGNYTSFNPFKQ